MLNQVQHDEDEGDNEDEDHSFGHYIIPNLIRNPEPFQDKQCNLFGHRHL
ncbi:hypothetical protein [Parasphingorhabdus sp.]